MEKLLDFKPGVVKKTATKMYRFQCDCLTAQDAMDVSIESEGEDDEGKYIILTFDFKNTNFWGRVKYAWEILKGDWTWRNFVVREEDLKDLSDIINPGKKFSELP